MSSPFIPAALRGTSLESKILQLDAIYERAEAAMEVFKGASGIACLSGCGECCKGFEPDIRPAEALYLAAWLSGPGKGRLGMLDRAGYGPGTCPFFDAEDPYHCQVYPARFLICRLFGFCAMRGKEGELDYSVCFAMAATGIYERKRWSAAELEASFGALPPLMSDFGSQAAAVEPEGIGRPEPVRRAMASALSKVGLAMSMGLAVSGAAPDPEEG